MSYLILKLVAAAASLILMVFLVVEIRKTNKVINKAESQVNDCRDSVNKLSNNNSHTYH